MSVFDAASRWQLTYGFERSLKATLQKHADQESDRLAAEYGEISGDKYAGLGVLLRIPDLVSIALKMDEAATVHPANCPAVFISGGGATTFSDAVSMTGRQAFGESPVLIAGYVTSRALYQGVTYRLTERELIMMAGALGSAIVNALQSCGLNSIQTMGAGVITANVDTLEVHGYKTSDDEKTTAAKILISVRPGHEMRY